jgi:hypothetical protein
MAQLDFFPQIILRIRRFLRILATQTVSLFYRNKFFQCHITLMTYQNL